ncbi:MAG: hypothetical protein HGB17_10165 [Syntrophobacteraceae bacterium]|nr:hypothetical protein [Syntrophobacteraceae bacterium]
MAIRPYVEGLREACDHMTKEQLTSFIIEMGQDLAMEARLGILARLR